MFETILPIFEKEFERVRALWTHDGNCSHPHAVLTSGLHSNRYFNATKVVEDAYLLERSVHLLLARAQAQLNRVTRIIGPERGAVELSFEIARQLRVKTSTVRKAGEGMEMVRFDLSSGDRILLCEDTVTTGGTTLKVIEEMRRLGAQTQITVIPKVLALANRSGKRALETPLGHFEIHAILDEQFLEWQADSCPLCGQGSRAIKHPKENWDELLCA